MTLRKQLVVLPVSTRVQIVEDGKTIFSGSVFDARKCVGHNELSSSSYVNAVIPLGEGKARILIKSNKVKEDA